MSQKPQKSLAQFVHINFCSCFEKCCNVERATNDKKRFRITQQEYFLSKSCDPNEKIVKLI